MALGCAFIFIAVLWLWRRQARKRRAKRTAMFATSKRLDPKTSWRWRLLRFGEKLFGHNASRRVVVNNPEPAPGEESEVIKLLKMRNAEEARHHGEMEKLELFGAYEYSRAGSTRSSRHAPSTLPSLNERRPAPRPTSVAEQVLRASVYSEVTGVPRNTPEPRQPINKNLLSTLSRYPSSVSSAGRSYMYDSGASDARLVDVDPMPTGPTEAQVYADAVKPALAASPPIRGAYWLQPLEPTRTGTSSNNPFRR
jgi:hypothetical protein